MNKYTIGLSCLVFALNLTNQTVFAEELNDFAEKINALVVSQQEYVDVESASIREIMQSPLYYPLYSSTPNAEEIIEFFTQIQRIKLDNPHLSIEELVKLIDEMAEGQYNRFNDPSALVYSTRSYDKLIKEWLALNGYEKALIASSPVNAAATMMTKNKAIEYTRNEYKRNRLGDRSDAFRHAIWNALMSKYINKPWAKAFATAHEIKTAEELLEIADDGNLESEHNKMDLHNNKEGRDCWKFSDNLLLTSDKTLISRVKAKFKDNERIAGQLYWLND